MYETIARLCFEKGITIAAMCKELGLRQEIVSDLKHGRAKMLSIGTASLIADYLAVTVDELVDPQRSIEDTTALSDPEKRGAPSSFNANVGRINALLAEKRISKQQFFKDCNITSAAYSLWNTGKTQPRLRKLAEIASYLGVTLHDVLIERPASRCQRTEKLPRYREFREKAGMTLDDVLRAVGISQKRLEDIELGVEDAPDDDAQKLAELYGCSPDQLREMHSAEPATYVKSRYHTKRAENIDALAREILRISHEQGLSLNDIKTACDKCERFVLQSTVPEDSRGWISRKYFF